jgi:hypothetical protein
MKLVIYIIIIISAAMAATYYFKPKLFRSLQETVTNKASEIIPIQSLSNKTVIYKWKDHNGVLQISNTPPKKGIKFITEEVQHSANIMPSEVLTGEAK